MADREVSVDVKFSKSGDGGAAGVKALENIEAAEKKVAKAAQETAAAQTAQTQAITKVVSAAQQQTTTTNKLSEAKTQLKKSTFDAGGSMLVFGQTLQDAQYGMAAISNQLPQLAASLGFGAGIAGVVAVAAVGIEMLVKHTDLFGTKAAKAATDAKKLADETNMAAFKAREHAEAMTAAEESARSLEARIISITKAYQDEADAIKAATAARKQDAAGEQDMDDADTAFEKAGIDERVAGGEMTEAEGETERRRIDREAARRKFNRQQKEKQAEAADAAKEANNAARRAAELRGQAKDLEDRGRGMLTPEERDRIQKAKEAEQKRIAEAQAEADTLPKPNMRTGGRAPNRNEMTSWELEAENKRDELRRKANEAATRAAELDRQLEADRQAKQRTGEKDGKTLTEEAEKLRREADAKDREAAEARRRMEANKRGVANEERVFDKNELARDRQSEARVIGLDRKRREEEAKAKEKQEKETGRDMNRLGKEGADVDRAFRGTVGARGLDQLQGAISRAQGGDDSAFSEIAQLIKLLAATAAAKDAKRGKELQELRSLIESLREGH